MTLNRHDLEQSILRIGEMLVDLRTASGDQIDFTLIINPIGMQNPGHAIVSSSSHDTTPIVHTLRVQASLMESEGHSARADIVRTLN